MDEDRSELIAGTWTKHDAERIKEALEVYTSELARNQRPLPKSRTDEVEEAVQPAGVQERSE